MTALLLVGVRTDFTDQPADPFCHEVALPSCIATALVAKILEPVKPVIWYGRREHEAETARSGSDAGQDDAAGCPKKKVVKPIRRRELVPAGPTPLAIPSTFGFSPNPPPPLEGERIFKSING
jgi:hypothetical protein